MAKRKVTPKKTTRKKSPRKNFASFRIRLAAGLIDAVVLVPFLVILTYLFGNEGYELIKVDDEFFSYLAKDNPTEIRLIDYLFYLIALIYSTYLIAAKSQATIGKKITGIYVGNLNGSRLSLQKSLMRALVSILTIFTFGLGFLLVIFTKEKTALHDIICRTRVFRKR